MKRHGNLYELIYEPANLYLAYKKARKGKRWQNTIKNFEKDAARNLYNIYTSLKKQTFITSPYRTKFVYEPKKREIFILPFYPDRIVQHAVMNVLEPIWDDLFYYHSYGCRKNKGIHKASKFTTIACRRNQYFLQLDISKFYPSIDHDILYEIIQKKIKCQNTLKLLKNIIYSTDSGVPIGNLTSQWFGNLYLNELDQFVKHELKIKDYVRYVDDFILLSDDKSKLWKCKHKIVKFLKIKLKLKLSKFCLRPARIGIDFVGYRHFPNKKLIRKRTAIRFRKNINKDIRRYTRVSSIRFRSKIASIEGWLKHAQSYNFSRFLKLNKIKKEIKMRGLPKHLNTKFDYYFIKDNNFSEWKEAWQTLLDGRFIWTREQDLASKEEGIDDETHRVMNYAMEPDAEPIWVQESLQESETTKLFRLGFTVEEVEQALA